MEWDYLKIVCTCVREEWWGVVRGFVLVPRVQGGVAYYVNPYI